MCESVRALVHVGENVLLLSSRKSTLQLLTSSYLSNNVTVGMGLTFIICSRFRSKINHLTLYFTSTLRFLYLLPVFFIIYLIHGGKLLELDFTDGKLQCLKIYI